MSIEQTLKNAREEIFISLINEIRSFSEHRDYDRIIEWTNLQRNNNIKYMQYLTRNGVCIRGYESDYR